MCPLGTEPAAGRSPLTRCCVNQSHGHLLCHASAKPAPSDANYRTTEPVTSPRSALRSPRPQESHWRNGPSTGGPPGEDEAHPRAGCSEGLPARARPPRQACEGQPGTRSRVCSWCLAPGWTLPGAAGGGAASALFRLTLQGPQQHLPACRAPWLQAAPAGGSGPQRQVETTGAVPA